MALVNQIPNIKVDVVKNDHPLLLTNLQYSHILISPGPDLPLVAGNLMQCLKNNYQQKNILGICLGHQALAEVLGCSLYNLSIPKHGLQQIIQVENSTTLFKNMQSQMQVGLYHSWAIDAENIPENISITANDAENIIMAFQHNYLPIYGVQFHPESYMTPNGLQIIKNWLI
jgi:para-aminobenzoate synthetase component II